MRQGGGPTIRGSEGPLARRDLVIPRNEVDALLVAMS